MGFHFCFYIFIFHFNCVGENLPKTLSATGTPKVGVEEIRAELKREKEEIELWFKNMWLSNIDLFRAFESAVSFDVSHSELPYTIVNGMSDNRGMRWSLENDVGYTPLCDVHSYESNELENV